MKRKQLTGICILLLLVLAAACAPEAPASLEETHWLLAEYGTNDAFKTPLPEAPVTAVFSGGMVSGSTGCNNYYGAYQSDNDKLTISGGVASTKKACSGAVSSQETTYLLLLKTVQSFKIEGSKLTLVCGSGQLIYKRV